MKITFVAPARGQVGDIKVVGEYAARLRGRGHDVTVLYHRTLGDLKRWLEQVLSRRAPDALDESGCPLVGVRKATAEAAPDADVVLAMGLSALGEAARLPPSKGRLAGIIQSVVPLEDSRREARAALALTPRLVAVSGYVAAYLKTTFGVEAAMVPNGVDHKQFYNPDRQFRVPRSVGMIYVHGPLKGTAEGFEAMRRVRDRWPDVRLVLFGARRPRRAPPRAEIYVRPKPSRLRSIYASCEIWLAPSRSEGFGLPVLEAMACRVVPVATRAGGHETLIEDNVSGFLVPVGDAEAMAQRLSLLIEDESLLRKMAEAAHERSLAFDWERSTDRLELLLKEWMA